MRSEVICIDQHEHFEKQSYRNRCYIFGPNGKQSLIIPVVHDDVFHTPVNRIRISFESRWKIIHWRSICSAYKNSPYFEFYEEEIKKTYDNSTEYLFEFNLALTMKIFELFNLKKEIKLTEEYKKDSGDYSDFRKSIHPKKNETLIKPYQQVFSDKHGFQNDLSCLDFLFNAGNKLNA